MNTSGKVKLSGVLSVVERSCTCCNEKTMLRLTGDEGQEFFYCKACFTDNCQCGGTKTTAVEK